MKTLTTKLMIAAAALLAAQAASAQVLKAEIPFKFQAAGKVMAAGTYRVDLSGTTGTAAILGRHSVSVAMSTGRLASQDLTARLVFECRGGSCSLVQAWSGTGQGVKFATPKRTKTEEASLTVIHVKAEGVE